MTHMELRDPLNSSDDLHALEVCYKRQCKELAQRRPAEGWGGMGGWGATPSRQALNPSKVKFGQFRPNMDRLLGRPLRIHFATPFRGFRHLIPTVLVVVFRFSHPLLLRQLRFARRSFDGP